MSQHLMLGLVFATAYFGPGGLEAAKKEKKHDLTAILTISTPTIRIGESPEADFRLTNTSKSSVTFLYQAPFYRSLDIEVVDPDGKKINKWKYGLLFSPNNQIGKATIKPGEAVGRTVDLFAMCPEADRIKPGTYKCRAIFDTEKGVRVVSETVEIRLTEKETGSKRGRD